VIRAGGITGAVNHALKQSRDDGSENPWHRR
jgi:hypothetical protein